MATVYKEVEVDVDLSDFDTDELIEELESRNATVSTETGFIVRKIYEKRKLGQDYEQELQDLIFNALGKIG